MNPGTNVVAFCPKIVKQDKNNATGGIIDG